MSSLITREKGISVEKKCSEISKDNETDGCIQGRNLPFSFPDQTTERTILGQVFFFLAYPGSSLKRSDSKLKLLARACFRLFNAGRK